MADRTPPLSLAGTSSSNSPINNLKTILSVVPEGIELRDHRALRNNLRIPPKWSDPVFSFLPDRLPNLLQIPSPSLAIQARTHRSSQSLNWLDGSRTPATVTEREVRSYEVLESLGDRKINSVVFAVMNYRFPFLVATALSDLAQRLFRNVTLSYLSAAYKLPETVIHNSVINVAEDQSVAADLFEAHVGALVRFEMETGESTGVDEWLKKIFDPDIWEGVSETASGLAEAVRILRMKRPKAVPVEHLSRWSCARCDVGFAEPLDQPRFFYDTHDQTKGWHAKVYIKDRAIGCGVGRSKAAAADQALKNEIAVRYAQEGEKLKNVDKTPEVSTPSTSVDTDTL